MFFPLDILGLISLLGQASKSLQRLQLVDLGPADHSQGFQFFKDADFHQLVGFSFDQWMPERGRPGVLELSILLEEHGDLEDNLIQILLLWVVVGLVGLDGLVVLEDRVILFQLFQLHPALAEQVLAEGRVEHGEIFNPADDFLELAVGLALVELIDHLLKFPQVNGFVANGVGNRLSVGFFLISPAIHHVPNNISCRFIADYIMRA